MHLYSTAYLRKRRIVRALVWTPITLAAFATCSVLGVQATQDAPAYSLPACETEASSNCYWDAQTRGNGEGQSFIDIEGRITYVP